MYVLHSLLFTTAILMTLLGCSDTPEDKKAVAQPAEKIFQKQVITTFYDSRHGQEPWIVERDGHAHMLKNINTTAKGSDLSHFTKMGGSIYFTAQSDEGYSLCKSDATLKNTTKVHTIEGGYIGQMLGVGDLLYFTVVGSGEQKDTLWRSDGTSAGTYLLDSFEWTWNMIGFKDKVYLQVIEGEESEGIFVSDGTVAGTKMAIKMHINRRISFATFGNALYYTSDSGVIKSDGTADGFVKISSAQQVYTFAKSSQALFFVGKGLSTGKELYVSDGTVSGTHLLKDIAPGYKSSNVENLVVVDDDILYFSADDNVNGTELWKSDGTEVGTVMVKDIDAGSNGSRPGELVGLDGKLYFVAYRPSDGVLLWESDGTASGTKVSEPIANSSLNYFSGLTVFQNSLFFIARDKGVTDSHSSNVYRLETDGYAQLTTYDTYKAFNPKKIFTIGDRLLIHVDDLEHGAELWKSDGTQEGTSFLYEFNTGDEGSISLNYGSSTRGYSAFVSYHDNYYFSANDTKDDFYVERYELYKSDATASGTFKVKEMAGTHNPRVAELTVAHEFLYFTAYDGNRKKVLWRSDGSTAGTVKMKDAQESDINTPVRLTVVGEKLFFLANTSQSALALWVSDGSEIGTHVVKESNVSSMYRYYLTAADDKLYFSDYDTVHGRELWVSEGTAETTYMLKDIAPDISSSEPKHLTYSNNQLYFAAKAGANSRYSLYKTDGTPEGTVLVSSGQQGLGFIEITQLVDVNGSLFFSADDDQSGMELWVSDGTPENTRVVKDINPGSDNRGGFDIAYMIAVDDKLYFTMDEQDHGVELWVSDATEMGTHLVKDINLGIEGSRVEFRNIHEGKLFFNAYDGTKMGLYMTDGTATGTTIVIP